MTEVEKQPTALPTRKILAVIVSGAVLGAVNSALDLFWPDHPLAVLMGDLDIWIQWGVMALAGYYTRERVDVKISSVPI
jgi:hypothetical protein